LAHNRDILTFAAASPETSRHWLFDLRRSERITTFVDGAGLRDYAQLGVATPEHVIRMKRLPLILDAPCGDIGVWTTRAAAALDAYIADYHTYFESNDARVGGPRTRRERA
jgi:rhamnose utilization protein RhaD (predicted bifunctional aldolase and dehydrogenase)